MILPEAAQSERWKRQRHGWGLLLIMSSLLVGCLIPISLGLFSGYAHLSSLILVLAGVAGLLLMTGSMFLMAAERAILVADDPLSVVSEDHHGAQTRQRTSYLHEEKAGFERSEEWAAAPAHR